MVVTQIGRRCLKARILSGTFAKQLWAIPRIKLSSTEDELPFIVSRWQFPIRLSFATTVNKSQGQSFNLVSVDLRMPVFTHGQLYVALFRVIIVNGILVVLPLNQTRTENIISPEALL